MAKRWEINEEDWDPICRILRSRLEETARRQDLITYRDLVAGVPQIEGPHSFALPWMLGQISRECHVEGLPLLSALVIYSDTPQAGSGFFDLARELGFEIGSSSPAKDEFWVAMVKAAYQTWREGEAPVQSGG